MDFAYSPKVEALRAQLGAFIERRVVPRLADWQREVDAGAWPPSMIEPLKQQARAEGLWNLFLPGLRDNEPGMRLTNLEYAPLAEITGRSPHLAPEALNCAAPDTGNMEILAEFGSAEQQQRWLLPLLEGEIRSCFSMTEPDVASSDARNISCRIERDGDDYVINGRKWWSSGAASPRCKVSIVMGVTNPDADPYHRQSMILVPFDTPGVEIVRNLTVFGYHDRGGHPELRFTDVRVPASNLLGAEGSGFAIAQARLGPGRIHHCMRLMGMAERAFELMCRRAQRRDAFGGPIADQGVVQDWIAESRIMIEQTRLLILKTAWLMDTVGNKEARVEISAIKVAAPRTALYVLDRAIQTHGGGGVSQDFPLASLWSHARTLQIADGPDEVHKRSVARRELRRLGV